MFKSKKRKTKEKQKFHVRDKNGKKVTYTRINISSAIEKVMRESDSFASQVKSCVKRFRRGDYGMVAADTAEANAKILESGNGRMVSLYDTTEKPIVVMSERNGGDEGVFAFFEEETGTLDFEKVYK